MLREDIFGTIFTVLFDIIAFIAIFVLGTVETPKLLSILGTIALGGVAIGATFKVGKYGFNKIKEKWN